MRSVPFPVKSSQVIGTSAMQALVNILECLWKIIKFLKK